MKYVDRPDDAVISLACRSRDPLGNASPIVPSWYPPYLLNLSWCLSQRPSLGSSPTGGACWPALLPSCDCTWTCELYTDSQLGLLSPRSHWAIFGDISITWGVHVMGRGLDAAKHPAAPPKPATHPHPQQRTVLSKMPTVPRLGKLEPPR